MSFECIEAISEVEPDLDNLSIFMAGTITGSWDWQKKMKEAFEDEDRDITLINPRRANFDVSDPQASFKQIEWEHKYLELADVISFYFSPETLNPITLFELGRWSGRDKKLFVCVHPDFKRKQDVEIQLKLERPDIEIVYDLDDLIEQIKDYYKELIS